jgi:FkbM family methyltransferase
MKMPLMSRFALRNSICQRACKAYVDFYAGDNNADIATNGELDVMRRALPAAKVVFDVGANVGDWASRALLINPLIALHCFEPSPTTFGRLSARAFPASVVRNNFGLSSAAGEASLFIFGNGNGMNSLYQRNGLEDGWGVARPTIQEAVRLQTFDGYCAANRIERVDFCKVDVEGHELEVFKGMSASLSNRTVQMVQFEYGGCNIDSRVFLKDIFSYFESYGYELHKIRPRAPRRVARYDQRLENFQYQNWVAVVPAGSVSSAVEASA